MTRKGIATTVASASESDDFLSILFGDDVKQQYHALAQFGTAAWRQAAQLTQRIVAANEAQPEAKRASAMSIYQQAAIELGCGEKAVQEYLRHEERFCDLLDEFNGTVTISHLRDICSEAARRKADPRDVFMEWASAAALYGVMKPHDLFAAEWRGNGKAAVPPMQRAATAATKNLATLLKHVSREVYATTDPSERRRWTALQKDVAALARDAERMAKRVEALLGEAEQR